MKYINESEKSLNRKCAASHGDGFATTQRPFAHHRFYENRSVQRHTLRKTAANDQQPNMRQIGAEQHFLGIHNFPTTVCNYM